MPLAQKAVQLASNRLPKVISPRTHFVVDYLVAGAFVASAAGLWRQNRKAAIGALMCGAAELLVVSLTTRPGGARRAISFRTHGTLDMGLAAMTAMMPEFMRVADTPQSRLFLGQSVLMTAVAGLTDFDADEMRTDGTRERRVARAERVA